jgi:ribosome maturation factor RimP
MTHTHFENMKSSGIFAGIYKIVSMVGEITTPFFISIAMQGYDQVLEEIQKRIEALNPDVFIVEMALKQSKATVLLILVDTDAGITISQCARISRHLNLYLEEEAGLEFPFNLEVSSPGVGRPFKVQRQYTKNVGRELKVKLLDGSVQKGKLVATNDEGITLHVKPTKKPKPSATPPPADENMIPISFDQIQEAVVEISFD